VNANIEREGGNGGGAEPHPAARRGLNYQPINWLLLIPLIGTLVPWFYNFTSPTIGGMPFFYWYQLLWIPISVFFTWIVFRATRNER
jgi:hypothetical protein